MAIPSSVGSDHFSYLPTARYDWSFAIYSAMAIFTSKSPPSYFKWQRGCAWSLPFLPGCVVRPTCCTWICVSRDGSFNNVVVPGSCACFFFPWASVSCSFRCDQLVHQDLVVFVNSLWRTTLVVIMIILPSAMLVSRRVLGIVSCSYLLHPKSIHKSHMRHAYEPDTVPEIWTVHKAANATTSLR